MRLGFSRLKGGCDCLWVVLCFCFLFLTVYYVLVDLSVFGDFVV